MSITNPVTSHARDLVAQIVHGDAEIAAALIKFCVLTDCSTPVGAATRLDALLCAYEFTDHCKQALEAFMKAA